jgi:hypothetical protein
MHRIVLGNYKMEITFTLIFREDLNHEIGIASYYSILKFIILPTYQNTMKSNVIILYIHICIMIEYARTSGCVTHLFRVDTDVG